jgi:putative FmdB family regulatory protein
MPKYSYKCQDCDNKFEVEASIKEKEEGGKKFNCPKCKSEKTKQIFSLKSLFSNDKNSGGGCCCSGGCK